MKKVLSASVLIIGIICSFVYAAEINSTNITQAPYNCDTSATSCNLSNKSITSIASGTFKNHNRLTELDLDYNQISSIELGDFNGLTNLTSLGLNSNQITGIESGVFNGLTNLLVLEISDNQITSIEPGDFSGLTNLTSLSLGNQISSIESGDFNGLTSLNELHLSNNQITSIEADDFVLLPNLTVINLLLNQITSIEANDFSEVPNLNYLLLSYNQITGIESGAFNGLTNLISLSLDYNQITGIESGAFNGLTNLNELYLNNNFMFSVDSNLFVGLPLLSILDLSYICTSDQISIDFNGNTSLTDNQNCGLINSVDPANFTTSLTDRGYSAGVGLLGNSEYYAGYSTLSFTPGITNQILENIIMRSANTNGYTQSYYQNTVEVQYDAGTAITNNGQNYTGILLAPTLLNTGSAKGLNNVVALTKFGDNTKSINFSQPVTIRIPALGKNIGDTVSIYYTQNLSSSWTYQTTTTVIDIGGTPYAEFTTDHATYFAIGEGGTTTGSFTINNDSLTTSSQTVTLNISGAGLSWMRFSNDNNTSRSDWESYSSMKIRNLSSGIGTKTVYAQFGISSQTGDIETSDTIEYIILGGINGQISLNILSGESSCVYGTSINLGAKDIPTNFGGLEFVGNFTGSLGTNVWSCTDYAGTTGGRDLTIQSADLINSTNNIISGTNVMISYDNPVLAGGDCVIGNTGSIDQSIGTVYTMIAKGATPERRVCKIQINNVSMKIVVPANQAPGSYSGLLTITLPNFN